MFCRIITRTRPNTNIPWFYMKASKMDEKRTEYMENGNIILHKHAESEDGLQVIAVTVWKSRDVYEEFTTDPIIKAIRQISDNYHIRYGINMYVKDVSMHEMTRESMELLNSDTHEALNASIRVVDVEDAPEESRG